MNSSDDETIPSGDSGQSASGLPPGTRLGDYEVEKLLGAGAMGQVYLARQVRLDQKCALKILPEELTRSADFEKRFEAEGRSLAKLDHPNIVRVLYAGEASGRHFLAMEYVPGGTLEDLLEKSGGRLPEGQVRKVLGEVLAALAYAHGEGVVHRDLKPANILIGKNGACKLADFGLALVAGEDYLKSIVQESVRAEAPGEEETILAPGSRASKRSSDAAKLVGTIDYMSPEVRAGKEADARSDLFAVGVMAYRMLTGRKPSVGRSKDPSKLVPGLDPAWDDWVFRCMEADPEERFQRAEKALAAVPVRGARKSRSLLLPFVLLVLILLAAAGGVWWFGMHVPDARHIDKVAVQETPTRAGTPDQEDPIDASRRYSAEAVRHENDAKESQPTRLRELSPEELEAIDKVYAELPGYDQSWTVPDCNIEMVRIAPGTFTMGSPDGENDHLSDETQHRVTLTRGYWLGKYEVTQGQWQAMMGSNPSSFKNAGANAPVENVSWDDAMEFCKKLTQKERAAGRLSSTYEYTLPTEAQWEYACRAGTTTSFSFGNDDGSLYQYGNYCDSSNTNDFAWKDTSHNDGYDKTAPVGSYKANAWGLYDMHGNVWEWCSDWYGTYPSSAVTDPTGATSGTLRVHRGGGWANNADDCRSAPRRSRGPGARYEHVGFRLALRSVQ